MKVLDFGISKLVPTKIGSATSEAEMSMTQTSASMGSPLYMSPEQIRSARNVDERTDIWALGVILFESLTCAQPFVAETVMQVCARILEGAPTHLRELRPEAPPELDAILARCLEKDPNGRFASVVELAAALVPFGSHHARMSADRVRRVATSAQRSVVSISDAPPPPSSSRPPPELEVATNGAGSVNAATVASWGDTDGVGQPRAKKRNAAAIVVTALVVIAAGGLVGFAMFRLRSAEPTVTAASTMPEEPHTTAPAPTPTVTPLAPADVPSAPAPDSLLAPSAAPTTTSAAAPWPPSPPRAPGGAAPARTTKSPDGLFDGRK